MKNYSGWAFSVCMSGAIFMGLFGCADKAAPSYAQCVQLDIKGDVGAAWDACSAAITVSPTSEAGRSATTKLAEMKPKYDVWKAAYDKKVAADQAAAARAQAKAAAEAARAEANRLNILRSKISKMCYGYRSNDCTGYGLPPNLYVYEGGRYSEDAEVARADGCSHAPKHSQDWFCCPD